MRRGPIRWILLLITVSLANLRQAPRRIGTSAAAVISIGGVVLVFVSVLAMADGFRRTMSAGADPATAIVLSAGSESEMNSSLSPEEVAIVAQTPGVARREGEPLASAELFVVTRLKKRSTDTDANVVLRGVEPVAYDLRRRFEIEEGFRFEPGQYQFVTGAAARDEFVGIAPGESQYFGLIDWTSVGVFSDGGSIAESELWTDLSVLQGAFQRVGSYSSVRVRLESPEHLAEFRRLLEEDPRLEVRVLSERSYYYRQSSALYQLITGFGTLIVVLMAVGAVFGATNSMYATVGARQREIGILRGLGFPATAILVSVLVEAVALAVVGGLLAALIAYLAVDGLQAATLNWTSFSQVVFAFDVGPDAVVQGIVIACVLGGLAGILPALRAVRQPVVGLLRQT